MTEAGKELATLVSALATWGQRWLRRQPSREDLDLEPVLIDMQRRVCFAELPSQPLVVRFEIRGHSRRYMLLKKNEASICENNLGFPEPVCVRGPLAALVSWWRGDMRKTCSHRTRWKKCAPWLGAISVKLASSGLYEPMQLRGSIGLARTRLLTSFSFVTCADGSSATRTAS